MALDDKMALHAFFTRSSSMSNPVLTLAAALFTFALGAAATDFSVTFEQDRVGTPPAGFTFSSMRQPAPGAWLVARHGTQQYLVHEADRTANGFSLAVHSAVLPAAFTLAAKLRLSGGTRVGGVIWHYQDEANYYALALDLARRQVSLYRVAAGNRIRLEVEDDLELDRDAWHVVKVNHDGHSTRVLVDGVRVFDHEDRRLEVRPVGGRAGLLAAGNASVDYDDLHVESSPRSR